MRSLLIGILFTLLFFGVIGRLYWVQVVEASLLLEKAESAWSQNKELPAVRGTIFDRNHKILAQDGQAYTVVVQPAIINSRNQESEIVELLAPLLNMTDADKRQKLYSLVTRKRENGQFFSQVEIRNEGWKVDVGKANEIQKAIEDSGIRGVFLISEQKRYYPAQELASHLLGYSNKEGEAVLGLEAFYDNILKGQSGMVQYDKDGKSFELPDSKITYQPAINGNSMKLTIDENIQFFIEQELEKAYDQFKPKSITAIAVDPNTLEVLGMANYPNYNPNEYWNFSDYGDFYNHAISSTYEPGSTFKIITLAAAVEEGIFNPDETYMSGRIQIGSRFLVDHNNGRGWGEISYLDGLKRSSNVAFIKLGFEGLGAEKLRQYIDSFGFGQLTGIDLPGEKSGAINFRKNVATEVATATFGQGRVTVTALQQIAAISAIANGGKLMKPYILKEIIDLETNEVLESFGPTMLRRVISEQTSRVVSGYLEQVISDQSIGTGWRAYLEDYQIAGKTGTAQKVVNGQYSTDKWVVSFIGYAPVNNPQIALLVIVDEPEIYGDYRLGGTVSGPVFREIMAKSLRYLDVKFKPKENFVTTSSLASSKVPNVIDLSVIVAENEIRKNGFELALLGTGQSIINQFPLAEAEMMKGGTMYLLTQKPDQLSTPDFVQMSLRDVLQLCGFLQLNCSVKGEGYVTMQMESIEDGKKKLFFELEPLSNQRIDETETDLDSNQDLD